jgi:hypothetical protein
MNKYPLVNIRDQIFSFLLSELDPPRHVVASQSLPAGAKCGVESN